jgi:hypothetical protein
MRNPCFALASESLSRRRGRGNVVIPKGFPKSVGRVGSRLYGFPCFPHSVISMAALLYGSQLATTKCSKRAGLWLFPKHL